jgi:hypothetical protein
MKVKKASIPPDSLVWRYLPADYSDAYACTVDPARALSLDPDELMVAFWTSTRRSWWVSALFRLRNFLVRFVGLQGSENFDVGEFKNAVRHGGSYGFMSIAAKNGHETVMLLTDKHLDAYLSIHVAAETRTATAAGAGVQAGADAAPATGAAAGTRQTVSAYTVVRFHNRLGRVYFFVIRPFHAIIAKTILRGAIKNAI